MHLGVARTSLAAWLDARKAGGRILLRFEDVDEARVVPGAAEGLVEDLRWLGLDFDGPITTQSQRYPRYEAAIAQPPATRSAAPSWSLLNSVRTPMPSSCAVLVRLPPQ